MREKQKQQIGGKEMLPENIEKKGNDTTWGFQLFNPTGKSILCLSREEAEDAVEKGYTLLKRPAVEEVKAPRWSDGLSPEEIEKILQDDEAGE